MKTSFPKRLAIHAVLIAGSILFLFPFAWLVATSLKPIEQTMKMPPDWLPRAYYATVEGERLEVITERQFLPKPIVRIEEGPWKGERVAVAPSSFRDGVAEIQAEVTKTIRTLPPSANEKYKGGPRPLKSTETLRVRATQVGELFAPFVFVEVEAGRRKGERVLLPAAKYRDGQAEVAVQISDRAEVQRVPAKLLRQVAKGDWLVRERINRLAQDTAPQLLEPGDVLDWRGFCSKLGQGKNAAPPALGRRLWEALPAEARQLIEGAARGAALDDATRSQILDALNEVLKRRGLAEAQALSGLVIPAEARELLTRDRDALSQEEVQRLNRLLLEASYPKEIRNTQSTRLAPRQAVVAAADLHERIQPAWWNYEGAIRYTGYYEFSLFGWEARVPIFLVYVYNTLVVAILGMIGTVLSSALAAYGFARIRWRGRETCFLIALSTMMIPFAVTMVPLYGVFRALGWIGTLKPLWVPAFFASAFNIFLLRQFFMTIPQDLSDAARIDGCSELGIFWRIMLPLSKPALAVVALFHFMWAWKDFMGPLIFLTEKHTFTLSLGLFFYQSQHGGSEWHYLMAASTLMILPVILLFFFTQRTFIQGISTTGLKG